MYLCSHMQNAGPLLSLCEDFANSQALYHSIVRIATFSCQYLVENVERFYHYLFLTGLSRSIAKKNRTGRDLIDDSAWATTPFSRKVMGLISGRALNW